MEGRAILELLHAFIFWAVIVMIVLFCEPIE